MRQATGLVDGGVLGVAGVAVKLNERLQLTLDVLDTFKSEPPAPGIGKNDVAVVLASTVKY